MATEKRMKPPEGLRHVSGMRGSRRPERASVAQRVTHLSSGKLASSAAEMVISVTVFETVSKSLCPDSHAPEALADLFWEVAV